MKYYLVKVTSVATDTNQSFAGEVETYYAGKEQNTLKREGTHRAYDNFDRISYMLKEYGYTRKCDAAKSYDYKHPENSANWKSTAEIVEIEA